MPAISKTLVALGFALLSLGQLVQACDKLESLAALIEFQSPACRKSVFNGGIDCMACEDDLPVLVSSLKASDSSDCRKLAEGVVFNCAYDPFNNINCGQILAEDSKYLNCEEGFFSCCIDPYSTFVGIATNYTEICAGVDIVIPDFGECTLVDYDVPAIDIPALPDNGLLEEFFCPEIELLVSLFVNQACFPPADDDDVDWSLLCSEECAPDLANLYENLIAINSTECSFTAAQLEGFCQYDTSEDLYCIDVFEQSNDTCTASTSCCGSNLAASFRDLAASLPQPFKFYLDLITLSYDASVTCGDGAVVADASTCETAAFITFSTTSEPVTTPAVSTPNGTSTTNTTSTPSPADGGAAQMSVWLAAALIAILSVYFAF